MFRRVTCLTAVVLVCAWAGLAAGAGLGAWYKFENDVLDSSGNGRDGVAVGAPVYVAGMTGYGQAIQIDAVDDTVTWANVPPTSAVTASIWVKLDPTATIGSGGWLLDQMIWSPSYKGWQIKVYRMSGANGDVYWAVTNTAGSRSSMRKGVTNLYDGNWHHIVGSHDGVTTSRVYFDGVEVGVLTGQNFMPTAAGEPVTLNERGQTALSGVTQVDDIRIYDAALTANEVQALYYNGLSMRVTPATNQAVTALEGSAPSPTLQSYTVSNYDMSVPSHTVTVEEVDQNGVATDYTWLSLNGQAQTTQLVISGGASAVLGLTIDHVTPATPAGVHTAYVRLTNDAVPALTETRQIQFTVIGCEWAVTPRQLELERYYRDGSADVVSPVVFTIENTGKHGLTYTVQEVVDQTWLTLSKGSGGPLNNQASDTVTATIDKTGLAVGTYTCQVRIENTTGSCNPAPDPLVYDYTVTLEILPSDSTIVAPGLLAYYRFEESVRDWTGNGWNGTVTGAPTYSEGDDGRSIEFHGVGSGDGVDLGDIPCPNPAVSQEMTVALWFRADRLAIAASWLVDKITSGGTTGWEGWQIKNSSEWFGLDWEVSTIQFRWCHDGLRDSLNTSAPNMNIAVPTLYDGNWHQIVMTIEDADGDAGNLVNVRGYYDGALIEGQNVWNQQPEIVRFERLGTTFVPAPVTTNVRVSGDIDRVLGGVDELSFWNRALSAQEIANMYQTGGPPRSVPAWADADEDGDVDQADFAVVQACYTGVGGAAIEACQRFNRDTDDDVDETDLDEFADCATGPGIPLDENNPPAGCDLMPQ